MNPINIFRENPVVFFSTVRDGVPKVRPLTINFIEDGDIYFSTLKDKELYEDLLVNPHVEFTAIADDLVTARVSGIVEFVDNPDLIQKALESNLILQHFVKDSGSDNYVVFYVSEGELDIFQMDRLDPDIRRIYFH
ncbi:MAG: pyridoxamine 5'-phosphate oxidase family protein [Spirochaetales bacterium]|nr:pyridoxamine 5'-phosphate oxidase family protein [Spirochaetales bacterium]